MRSPDAPTPTLLERPKRADASRNYDKVLAAAREAFADGCESPSLEGIARRAGVGIGTLYRHFPTRQAMLEALYLSELEDVCRSAAELDDGDPWDALDAWLERFVAYFATKRALADELSKHLEAGALIFQNSRDTLYAAAAPLLKRAQDAGAARTDVEISDVLQMVMSIAKLPSSDPAQTKRVMRVALDGLRHGRSAA